MPGAHGSSSVGDMVEVFPYLSMGEGAVTETSEHIGEGGGREVHTYQKKRKREKRKNEDFSSSIWGLV
jgi:hypothetical protein